MLFSLLYESCLIVLALLMFPYFLFQLIFKKKYRQSFFQRLGFGFPVIDKKGRPLIWVHAISMGETRAVSSLVKLLKADGQSPIILFSNITETGHAEALRSINADYHVFMPFDFGFVIKRIVKRVCPDLVILSESDFWVNFLTTSKKIGASLVLVNGKISERSLGSFIKFPYFASQLFQSIDLFCVQSAIYGRRFMQLGFSKDKIAVTGNIKFDGAYPKLSIEKLQILHQDLGVPMGSQVIVMGSSHNPEELLFIQMLQEVWKINPTVKGVLVPRHPERFDEVARLLQKNNISFHRLSQKGSLKDLNLAEVILVDSMGILLQCYQLATIAIVGGSYTDKIGGHNILEPSWYGIPVVFGPYMHNQPDLVDLSLQYEAGVQVSSDMLSSVILSLLDDEDRCKKLGNNGLQLASDLYGATAKTFDLLKDKISKK